MSFLNNLMHSARVFREDGVVYTSKACVNRESVFRRADVVYAGSVDAHDQIRGKLSSSNDLLMFIVFKLLDRNIFIADRNVALFEFAHAGQSSAHRCAVLGESHLLHCDVVAFNAKKRLIYSISICDDPKLFRKTCVHALRLGDALSHIKEDGSAVVPLVLTMYDYETNGTLRLYNPLCKTFVCSPIAGSSSTGESNHPYVRVHAPRIRGNPCLKLKTKGV